jgi:hypothetical protein
MPCPSCNHDNPGDASFCEGCGAKLELACPTCKTLAGPGARFCKKCGASLGDNATAAPLTTNNPAASNLARSPRAYTSRHLGGEDSAIEGGAGRRAQAGDDAVRRHQGLDRAGRPDGRGRVVADHEPLFPDPLRRRRSLRGLRRQVHRRRHHGAVRRADRARGPSAARLYAALHLREEISRYATEVKRAHGVRFSTRMGLNSGEVIVGKIGTTCAWTTPRKATLSAWRPADGSARRAEHLLPDGGDGGAGARLLRAG